jgi:hypothetical protein
MTDLAFLQMISVCIGLILALGVALAVLVSGLTATKADALDMARSTPATLRGPDLFSTHGEFEDD